MRMLVLMLLVGALLTAGCPSKSAPPPPAQSPAWVKHEVQQMKEAKANVEAAQKKEEVRDDKIVEQAK